MIFMVNKHLEMAYTKSNEIVKALDCEYRIGIIDTEALISAVGQRISCDVIVTSCSFGKIGPNIRNCGAMMLTEATDNKKTAKIVLNNDNPEEFQIFSLVHELGHLIIDEDDGYLFHCDAESNREYVVSTHVNYNISSIKMTDYIDENDNVTSEFLLNEQLANIFALRVLMPTKAFFSAIREIDSLSEVAERYGVSQQAVISRIMLVE